MGLMDPILLSLRYLHIIFCKTATLAKHEAEGHDHTVPEIAAMSASESIGSSLISTSASSIRPMLLRDDEMTLNMHMYMNNIH